MHCILCDSDNISILSSIDSDLLIEKWASQYQINILNEIDANTQIYLYECKRCELQFYYPNKSGSKDLYASLQCFQWYYMSHKWEHDVAFDEIDDNGYMLEIGCGRGDFIHRLISSKNIKAVGIELNDSAIKEAQLLGRPVYSYSEFKCNDKFDIICCFQVLEHLPNPKEFIENCIRLLKYGGRFIISVPNNESFIKYDKNNLFNYPPHHITKWSSSVFNNLTSLYPLSINKIQNEPLSEHHIKWYLNVLLNRMPYLPLITGIIWRSAIRIMPRIINTINKYKHIQGHSLYISYIKR